MKQAPFGRARKPLSSCLSIHQGFLIGCLAMGLILAGTRVWAADSTPPSFETGMPYSDSRIIDPKAGPWESPKPDAQFVLENEFAKVVVWPEAGGAITEYIQKKTGTNFVAGKVTPGKAAFGWKEYTRESLLDSASEWFGSQPHLARRVETPMGPGVEVTCRIGGIEIRRLVVLDPKSAKLTIVLWQKNVGDRPQRLLPRLHLYTTIGDPKGESTAMVFPTARDKVGKIRTGSGFDNTFLNPQGYALMENWLTGEGLWMTFDPTNVRSISTWTGVPRPGDPLRGAFVIEPWPMAVLGKPGQVVESADVFYPYTKETLAADLPVDALPDGALREDARRFAQLVPSNLEMIGSHTMQPQNHAPSATDAENRFSFNVPRPDWFALRDWGIADALFAMPEVQDLKARARYFARYFPGGKTPVNLRFVFTVRDASGKAVIEQEEKVGLDAQQPLVDLRRDFDLTPLPDGSYEASVEVFEQGTEKPIHRIAFHREMVLNRRNELAKTRKFELVESPFVKALREVEFQADSLKALRIPIGVEEASGIPRTDWPVFAGVPFAKGMIKSDTPLRLVDPSGKEVVFDRTPSGTWDDGSVRWLLLRFNASVPANGHVFYNLESGPSKIEWTKPLLSEADGVIHFDNGSKQWDWNEKDGLGPIRAEDLWWTDTDGKRYVFQLKGEGAGLEIEENGAVRAVVRATGWYFAEGIEKPIARGIIRFEGYRTQPQLRISHNVMFAGNPWTNALKSCGLVLPLPDRKPGAVQLDLDQSTVSVDGKFTLDQRNKDYCTLVTAGGERAAKRAGGVFSFPTTEGARTVVFRDFWEMCPKQVTLDSADAKSVTLSYWPESAGVQELVSAQQDLYSDGSIPQDFGIGMSRTQELVVIDGPAPDLQKTELLFNEPVLAIVPPRYLAQTKAMMHLQPFDPVQSPEVESLISEIFDSYILSQKVWGWYGQWVYGALRNQFIPSEYRWADHSRYGWVMNEMDIVQTPWLAYMRSGDRKYYKFAEANTRQVMEAGTIHWNDLYPETVGLSRRHNATVWYSPGDFAHSMLDPFLDMYRMTGEKPAWDATQAMADAMGRFRSKDLTWRYISNPLAGLSRMYLETQDPKYLKEANRIWTDICEPDQRMWWDQSHGDRAVMYYSQLNPNCRKIWEDWALKLPGRFIGMDSLSALYDQTKNPKYAQAVLREFEGFPQTWDAGRTTDPLIRSLGSLTQFNLNFVRQAMYAGEAIRAGKKEPKLDVPAVTPTTMSSD